MRLGSGRSGNVINAGGGGRAGLGIGGLLVLLVGAFFGLDLGGVVGQGGGAPVQSEVPAGEEDETQLWLRAVLGDTDEVWSDLFQEGNIDYPEPTMVRFEGQVQSGCGTADSRMGPFYCPADQRLYLDPTFFDELARMGAPGDFAAAYVIAHEVGHHIQNLEGTLEAVDRRKRTLPEAQANQLSVATELQADCYAGVWAHHAESQRDVLEDGEVEEGLQAAASVGDDRLMEAAGMEVQPESFSHGSSASRMEWFNRGFESGSIGQCDTFSRN